MSAVVEAKVKYGKRYTKIVYSNLAGKLQSRSICCNIKYKTLELEHSAEIEQDKPGMKLDEE